MGTTRRKLGGVLIRGGQRVATGIGLRKNIRALVKQCTEATVGSLETR